MNRTLNMVRKYDFSFNMEVTTLVSLLGWALIHVVVTCPDVCPVFKMTTIPSTPASFWKLTHLHIEGQIGPTIVN